MPRALVARLYLHPADYFSVCVSVCLHVCVCARAYASACLRVFSPGTVRPLCPLHRGAAVIQSERVKS